MGSRLYDTKYDILIRRSLKKFRATREADLKGKSDMHARIPTLVKSMWLPALDYHHHYFLDLYTSISSRHSDTMIHYLRAWPNNLCCSSQIFSPFNNLATRRILPNPIAR